MTLSSVGIRSTAFVAATLIDEFSCEKGVLTGAVDVSLGKMGILYRDIFDVGTTMSLTGEVRE